MDDNGPTTSFLREDGAPEWDAISFDVCCSRCGYNLRTLSRGLCPECGLAFEWREVLDRSAFTSDFLFEHQWRTRPIGSLALTIWRSFRPRAFWSRVSIHEHVRPGPLIVFPLLAVIAFPVVVHGGAFLGAGAYELIMGPIVPSWAGMTIRTGQSVSLSGSIADTAFMLKAIAGMPFNAPPGFFWIFPLTLGFFLATTLLLCSLRQTLGRCKVRCVQIFRVTAYSSIAIAVWAGAISIVNVVVENLVDLRGAAFRVASACTALLLLTILPTIYLRAGLKHYLKLPRPGLLAGAASLVGLGIVVNAILFLQVE